MWHFLLFRLHQTTFNSGYTSSSKQSVKNFPNAYITASNKKITVILKLLKSQAKLSIKLLSYSGAKKIKFS